ncbi:MAG TPA: double zinc ribbon domain-containing protein, partial [Polyangiaceae bacterium]
MLELVGEILGDLVSPPRCAACDEPVARATVFCPPCAASVETHVPLGDVLAPYRYGGALARAIARFKYEDRADLARPLGSLLLRGLPLVRPLTIDAVVPVPLHPARAAERGFNQSMLLAKPLALALDRPVHVRALERVRDTPRQATLDRTHRHANVAAAFVARMPALVRGKALLVVDDVRTTGATAAACTSALLAAGASHVHVLTLA